MAFFNRYSTTTRGGIRFIGNTLGLSKLTNQNAAGLEGSIGAFVTLTGTTVPTFPAGTTLTYTQNSSSATLNLPAGSAVLYAELIWGGNYLSASQNISAVLNNPINFTTPLSTVSITQSPTTAQSFTYTSGSLVLGYYMRSSNVTALVQAAGNGTYSAGSIPGLVDPIDNNTQETNHAGWTLAVIYSNPAEEISNLNLWVGGEIVSPNTPSVDVSVTGFTTPATGSVSARIFISAGEGDAVLTGDQCLFGPTAASLSNLSGPRNPAQNFFASQICDENGQLDTSGTFGNRNANPVAGTNVSAGRQGWDITSVDGSAFVNNLQTSAVFRFTSNGDLYIPNALGIKIEAQGAFIEANKTASPNFVNVGQPINYTVTLTNSGAIGAENVQVEDFLSAGLQAVPGSVFVDGVSAPGGFPLTIPLINTGQTVTVTFQAVANSVPVPNPVENSAGAEYTFFPFPDFPVQNTANTPVVTTPVIDVQISSLKAVDRAYAVTGDELTYTVTISNNGNVDLFGMIFRDPVPAGTSFVDNSVIIDGIPQPGFNPDSGFPIGTLTPGTQHQVIFKVTVN